MLGGFLLVIPTLTSSQGHAAPYQAAPYQTDNSRFAAPAIPAAPSDAAMPAATLVAADGTNAGRAGASSPGPIPAADTASQDTPSPRKSHDARHHKAGSKQDAHGTTSHGQALENIPARKAPRPGAPHPGIHTPPGTPGATPGADDKTEARTALPQKSHRPSLKEKLDQAEQALAGEQDDQKAQSLMKKAETLRLFSVQNGGRLLLSAAQDALKQGHADEAEKTLSAAVTLQPDNAFLRRQRAAIRLVGNDFTGAVEDLQQALVKDPGDAQSWDLLARTQEHLHHPGQALHAYTEALTHAPLLPGGQARYQELEQKAHGRPD